MAYKILGNLPTAEEIIAQYPLSSSDAENVAINRHEVQNILAGHDPRLLIVIGPCSAWPSSAVLEYAKRLAKLNQQINDVLKLVMRVYIQKPRTVTGWTGPINQPNPNALPDINHGLVYSRQMMLEVVASGLAIADEALFPSNASWFIDLLSWVAVGARSSEDPGHRIFASSLDCAVGMKNPTHGALSVGVNGVIAAQASHTAIFENKAVETSGNPYAHLVLRGSDGMSNYSLKHLTQVHEQMLAGVVKNPAILIDVSHDNCIIDGQKNHQMQPRIIFDILDSIAANKGLNNLVKGFMLESFLHNGRQDILPQMNVEGLSITDPCLGWDDTERFLLELASLQRMRSVSA